MASYEEDHNISNQASQRQSGRSRSRHNQTLAQQPDLASFFAMDRDNNGQSSSAPGGLGMMNGAGGNPFRAMASALENMQDSPLAQTLITQLMAESEEAGFGGGSEANKGVPQEFLDSLDRVPRKRLTPSDECAICATAYLEDSHPLVVRLPCKGKHHFDLECIGPWLKLHSTCPMCRQDMLAKKEVEVVAEDSEEEWDDTYG